MNTALGFEIYRGVWFIAGSNDVFNNMLRDAKTAVYDPNSKLNTFAIHKVSAKNGIPTTGTVIAMGSDANNSSSSSDKKISVTNLTGVLTKSGGASSRGAQEISADMLLADADPNVLGHFVKIDGPGGSGIAMNYMKKTMKMLTKPKVTMVTRQGMAASAHFGILCEGDWVMAESGDAEVGCHGVMWGASGVPNGQKDGNGEVNFVVVSSTSPNKNKAQFDAINKNDTSLMQAEVDKLHGDFKASTRSAMPNIKDEQMLGDMFPASEVVGTMINAIGSESDAINKILELSNSKTTFNKNLNNQSKAMTAAEYKAQHPEEYAKVFGAGKAEGITAGSEAEKDRVETWMVYQHLDPEAVAKGIESGKLPSNKEQAAFNLKAATVGQLDALKKDSAKDLLTDEAKDKGAVETAEEKEFKALYPKATFKVNPNFQEN